MANNGLHKLVGAGFKRLCPGLCPTCVHLQRPTRDDEWEYCARLNKRLSNPHTTPGKCADYERGELKMTDAEIEGYHQDARDFQAWTRTRR